MANTPKSLYIGTPSTSSATLYTVPASTTTIVKEITLNNTTSSSATITVAMGGKNVITAYSVSANDTVVIGLSTVLSASSIITGLQGTINAVNLFISGVEVV